MHSRLQQLFGSFSPWILHPHRSALACVTAWLFSLPLTWQHPWLALFGFCAIWALTLALWLEASWLQFLPLPPLTVLLLGLCLRWGLGPLLLALGGSGGDPFVEIWVRYGPPAQLLWMSLTASLLIFASTQRYLIQRTGRSQSQSPWLVEAFHQPRFRSQVTILALLLSAYMAAYIILSFFSGAFDRQLETYISWTKQLWRLDTPVAAFSRLRDFWFLLFPLWWRLLSRKFRWFLGAEMLAFLAAALLSGSRGLLFYPALMYLFGLWFTLSDTRPIRRLTLALALMILLLSPLIYVVRESSAFQTAENWSGRLEAVGSALTKPAPLFVKMSWLGRDLYACHDPYLFVPENISNPPAGFDGLGNLPYLWLPKHLMPNRPQIFDGHVIAKRLQGLSLEGREMWFPCLSLPADLMRRWCVSGVLLGSIFVAAFLLVLLRIWYRTASTAGSTFNLLLMLLPATYLQSFPFGTVSETAWSFLWELPKYLIFLWLIGAVVDRFLLRTDP